MRRFISKGQYDMTITIDLTQEEEARLQAEAYEQGLEASE